MHYSFEIHRMISKRNWPILPLGKFIIISSIHYLSSTFNSSEISKVVAHMWENIEPEVKEVICLSFLSNPRILLLLSNTNAKLQLQKKEYLKQLAAYRAVQVNQSTSSSFVQTSTMHHLPFDPSSQGKSTFHSTPLITDNNNLLSSHHTNFPSYHPPNNMQPYCPPQTQFTNYNNYLSTYPQDNSSMHYSNPYSSYSSYDCDNPNPTTQYGLLRPALDSDVYSSTYYSNNTNDIEHSNSTIVNENLLQNLNHSVVHYTDLSSGNPHTLMEKHYDYLPPTLNELDKDDPNNSHFHWNSTACLATQW